MRELFPVTRRVTVRARATGSTRKPQEFASILQAFLAR